MSRELAERCKGRWPDILRRLGVLSSAALAGKDVPCPMCGGHDRFRFSDKGFGRWFCRGCGQGGDGVRLIQAIKRIDFALAAAMVESVVGRVSYASAASGASGASHTSTSGSEALADAPKDLNEVMAQRRAVCPQFADRHLSQSAVASSSPTTRPRPWSLVASLVALGGQDALASDVGAGWRWHRCGRRHHHASDLH